MVTLILEVVALVVGVVLLIQSTARDLVGWAILALALALLLPKL